MKQLSLFILVLGLLATGCSGEFWGGTATGGVGALGGYEYNFHRQMERIDKDLKEGKIDQEEYDIRKSQIQRDSLLK